MSNFFLLHLFTLLFSAKGCSTTFLHNFMLILYCWEYHYQSSLFFGLKHTATDIQSGYQSFVQIFFKFFVSRNSSRVSFDPRRPTGWTPDSHRLCCTETDTAGDTETDRDTGHNYSQKNGDTDTVEDTAIFSSTAIFFKMILAVMRTHILSTKYLGQDSYRMHYWLMVYPMDICIRFILCFWLNTWSKF